MERLEDILDLLSVLYVSINGRPCELVQLMELVLCLRDAKSYGVALAAVGDETERLLQRLGLSEAGSEAKPPPPPAAVEARAEVMYQALVDLAQLRSMAGVRHETNIDLLYVDPEVQLASFRRNVIDRIEPGAPKDRWAELLRPKGDYSLNNRRLYDGLTADEIAAVNAEFVQRANVVIARLGVTASAFLNTTKGTEAADQLLDIVREALGRIATIIGQPFVSPTLVQFATAEDLVLPPNKISSSVKNLLLPDVPDRGGIPEGFSNFKIQADVIKSNAQLKGQVVRVNEDRRTIWVGEKPEAGEPLRTRRFIKADDDGHSGPKRTDTHGRRGGRGSYGGGLSRRERDDGEVRRVVYSESPRRTAGRGGSPMRGSSARAHLDNRRVVQEEVRRADLTDKNPPLGDWN